MRYILVGLVVLLSPALAHASSPNLCDDVHLDPAGLPIDDSTGMPLARFCTWTNELDVTVFGDDVCCTFPTTGGVSCKPTDSNGRCIVGAKFFCDYGALSGAYVTCQQPWPDACVAGFCSTLPVGGTPLGDSEPLCCTALDVCVVVDSQNPTACGGDYLLCEAPFSNEDGSVGCSDDE